MERGRMRFNRLGRHRRILPRFFIVRGIYDEHENFSLKPPISIMSPLRSFLWCTSLPLSASPCLLFRSSMKNPPSVLMMTACSSATRESSRQISQSSLLPRVIFLFLRTISSPAKQLFVIVSRAFLPAVLASARPTPAPRFAFLETTFAPALSVIHPGIGDRATPVNATTQNSYHTGARGPPRRLARGRLVSITEQRETTSNNGERAEMPRRGTGFPRRQTASRDRRICREGAERPQRIEIGSYVTSGAAGSDIIRFNRPADRRSRGAAAGRRRRIRAGKRPNNARERRPWS